MIMGEQHCVVMSLHQKYTAYMLKWAGGIKFFAPYLIKYNPSLNLSWDLVEPDGTNSDD
jgi:hypothetical protein